MWEKTIAGILVIIGSFGFGLALCRDMSSVIYHLKEQKRMLAYMINEISFLHKPMKEVLEAVSEKVNEPYKTFTAEILAEIKKGDGSRLSDIWKKKTEDMDKNRKYPKKVTESLMMFEKGFGGEQDKLQIEVFKMMELELQDDINKMLKEKEEKSRLIQTLSILAGVFCIIIFI